MIPFEPMPRAGAPHGGCHGCGTGWSVLLDDVIVVGSYDETRAARNERRNRSNPLEPRR